MWSKLLDMSLDILRLHSIAHHSPGDLSFDKSSNIPELVKKKRVILDEFDREVHVIAGSVA